LTLSRNPGAGGAILTSESIETPSSEKKMIGSMLIMEADNMDKVRKAIEEDIYYTSGVVSDLVSCSTPRSYGYRL
jgi:hypothetical protein